jgi:cell division protein FtsB
VQDHRGRPPNSTHTKDSGPYITRAVGLQESPGQLRARRSSLFTQTIIWVTGLVCIAFLLGSLAQAWSNSQLMQRVEKEQQQTQQLQAYHDRLQQQVKHYNDPFVIESEARQELGYIRPGEHPLVIVGSSEQGQQSNSHAASQPETQNFWQVWWNVFFGSGI